MAQQALREQKKYSGILDEIKKESIGLNIVTTEKDLVKLRDFELPEKLSALRIEFSVDDRFYDYLFELMGQS